MFKFSLVCSRAMALKQRNFSFNRLSQNAVVQLAVKVLLPGSHAPAWEQAQTLPRRDGMGILRAATRESACRYRRR